MPEPFKPRKVEIFSEGNKVLEVTARSSCNTLSTSVGYERSPEKENCGQRKFGCADGWTYYSTTFGACGPGCWKYFGDSRTTCGYKGWAYAPQSWHPILEYKWRHTIRVFENSEGKNEEVGSWVSRWLCYGTTAQQAEYAAAEPKAVHQNVQWCNEGFILCGYPCWSENSEWCCLDCDQLAKRMKQLAEAAEEIKQRFN